MSENLLRVENLSKRFGRGGRAFSALDGVSLSAAAGEVVAIMGPNGSGKSTLLKAIVGLVLPDSGRIQYQGQDILAQSAWRHQLGYMPQIARYPENLSVSELMSLVQDVRSHHTALDIDLIEAFGIDGFSHKKLGALSGGMKQRVNACLAFWFKPNLIILDEPTASLDPLAAEQLKAKIRQEKDRGRLILLTSHIVSEVEEVADRIVYMLDGRIEIDASPAEIRGQSGEIRLSGAIAATVRAHAE
ncbi:MAG TPA: ABC transporter ATP-binding protein [Candidatus Obscuribacterales bacterium]